MAPAVGFEPTTNRLTADRSTTELRWNFRRRLRGRICCPPSPRAASLFSHATEIQICNRFVFGILIFQDAGWSSLVARQAHNLKAAGSNPAPATNFRQRFRAGLHLKRTGSCPQWQAANFSETRAVEFSWAPPVGRIPGLFNIGFPKGSPPPIDFRGMRSISKWWRSIRPFMRFRSRRWSNAGAAVRRIDLCSTSNCIGCYRGTRLLQNNFPRNCAP